MPIRPESFRKRPLTSLLIVLLSAGGAWPGALAQPHAEVLYSLEIDWEDVLSAPAATGTERDHFPPEAAPGQSDARGLAASLAGATAIRAYVYEPIAGVPTPRLFAALVTAAEGEAAEHRWLTFHDEYLPSGSDMLTLGSDAPDVEAALEKLLRAIDAVRLRPLEKVELGFAGSDTRTDSALADAARLLHRAAAKRADAQIAALVLAVVPRTVETFDAGAGAGGAIVLLLESQRR